MEFAGCSNDGSFGPSAHGCRGDFDFTIKFERIILSLLPSSVFVAIAAPRLITLLQRPKVVARGTWYQIVKVVAILVLATIQLALVGLSAYAKRLTSIFVSSTVLDFLATLAAAAISFFEHSRSPRPSIILGIYLPLLLLFDAAQTRSMWLVAKNHDDLIFIKVFSTGMALRGLILLLESRTKRRWLDWKAEKHSPEESASVYSLATYTWVRSLLRIGYKKILIPSDLLPLDTSLTVESLAQYTEKIHPEQFRHKKHALARCIPRVFAGPLLLPIAPRIASLTLQLCQPLLIQSLLAYLDAPNSSDNIGYGLIGAVAIIFLGFPLFQALDVYFQYRFSMAIRGTLVAMIYQHTTRVPSNAGDDSAALTLMSVDVERIRLALQSIHNFWTTPLQVGVSFWLLYRQIGASFTAPLIVILVCVLASVSVTQIIGRLQTKWMGLVQVRVGKTSNIIGNMKNIKLSGLTMPIQEAIQDMRVNEIAAGTRYRAVDVIITAFGFAPGQLAATFTFIFTTRILDASVIFSSVAYIALLSNPINMWVQRIPVLISGLACLQRVQNFLEKEPRCDFRTFAEKPTDLLCHDVGTNSSATAIAISGASMGWQSDKYVVKNVSASLISGFNMVIGPVASGKSTFCKGLLGETPSFKGQVLYQINAREAGFCDQVPVLLNANVQENIIGFLPFEETRYKEVIHATLLTPDLDILPHGDQTNIGSNGIALSGGQKQRVSLARALYKDFKLYVFDDVLSGLDVDTEQKVFERVFGPAGLLKRRGATTVLCTHSVRHLPDADHILALSAEGRLVEEGHFVDLMAHKSYVYSLGVQEKASQSDSGDDAHPVDEIQDESDAAKLQTNRPTQPEAPNENDLTRSMGDTRVFKHYCKSIGVFWLLLFFLSAVGLAFFGVSRTFGSSSGPQTLDLALVIPRRTTSMSGTALHKSALKTLCNAPLSFFTGTDVGILINLFSQDMNLIDDELPNAFVNAMACLAIGVGGAAVAATSSPYVLISYPFVILGMYFLQRYYLRTSRQIRLLGLEAKSPLYTNFIDTIQGIVTFRAFGWTAQAIEKNNGFLNASQRPAYLQLMIQLWLITLLDLMIGCVACIIVILATQLKNSPGFVGAGMVSIILCGRYLGSYILEYTQLENSLGAVSRLKSFDDKTISEHLPGEDVTPPPSWPEKGRVVLRNVSASYMDDHEEISITEVEAEKKNVTQVTVESTEKESERHLALRGLNLTIEPGQKIAICGRTGSGKSSTVLLLLRLINPIQSWDMTLSIDDQPLEKVNRTVLRERVIAVPQEPVFLPDGSTFLHNLDLHHQATEDECQAALEAVNLWGYVQDKGGLQAGLNAEELSQGQKQLFSLGRAILRRRVRSRLLAQDVGGLYLSESEPKSEKGRATEESQDGGLLILDEYSSSLDVDTDRTMQAIIRREFVSYTVIMVSHRLEMVMGFDKVVILDAGAVAEEGAPLQLAETPSSRFKQLLSTGKAD